MTAVVERARRYMGPALHDWLLCAQILAPDAPRCACCGAPASAVRDLAAVMHVPDPICCEGTEP